MCARRCRCDTASCPSPSSDCACFLVVFPLHSMVGVRGALSPAAATAIPLLAVVPFLACSQTVGNLLGASTPTRTPLRDRHGLGHGLSHGLPGHKLPNSLVEPLFQGIRSYITT